MLGISDIYIQVGLAVVCGLDFYQQHVSNGGEHTDDLAFTSLEDTIKVSAFAFLIGTFLMGSFGV